MIKLITKIILLCSFSLLITSCANTTKINIKNTLEAQSIFSLATALPIVESMASELVRDTGISLHYLPPPRYSVKRIPGWLKRQDINTYPQADAAVGISSVWPSLDIYPALRVNNIQIVPIDVAHAYLPKGESITLSASSSTTDVGYFWLNPANALIMLGILERDLANLLKHFLEQQNASLLTIQQHLKILADNKKDIVKKLRQFQINLDATLLQQDYMQVVIDSPSLKALASATLLPIISLEEANNSDLPTLLISNKKPQHKRFKSLSAQITLWAIDDFSKPKKDSFTERWENILAALIHK